MYCSAAIYELTVEHISFHVWGHMTCDMLYACEYMSLSQIFESADLEFVVLTRHIISVSGKQFGFRYVHRELADW